MINKKKSQQPKDFLALFEIESGLFFINKKTSATRQFIKKLKKLISSKSSVMLEWDSLQV